MKNFLLCLVLSFSFIACSTDTGLSESQNNASLKNGNNNLVSPQNKTNPFDSVGKQYYDALMLYRQKNQFPNSISEITAEIKFASKDFRGPSLTGRNVIPFTDEIVESIMADPDNSMIAIVQGSTLSAGAKATVVDFLQGLILQRDEEFNLLYNYVVSYESSIIANTTLTTDEKDTILTIASISRYSLYSEAERKDRDWETSVGSRKIQPFFSPNEAGIISTIAILDKMI